jgi:VWFA-related protein
MSHRIETRFRSPVTRSTHLSLLLLGALLASAAAGRAQDPQGTFGERIEVRLSTFVVRVLDSYGAPILGLKPEDFRVTAGRREIPVSALDWQGFEAPRAPARAPDDHPSIEAWPPLPPRPLLPVAEREGRTLVFFVQADINAPNRTKGHLRMLPLLDEVLATLTPADRVAVVSFDSHLKLWQDLTADRGRVKDALWHAVRFGGRPPEPPAAELSPFAAHFERDEPVEVATPERAIQVMADALSSLPGEKVVVYLGWGLGAYTAGVGTRMTHEYGPARDALARAHATVFVIDVDDSIYHDLEVGLRQVAADTGGTYEKTTYFPSQATSKLARAITGYYLLSIDPDRLPAGHTEVKIDLRGRRGTVLVRPTGP